MVDIKAVACDPNIPKKAIIQLQLEGQIVRSKYCMFFTWNTEKRVRYICETIHFKVDRMNNIPNKKDPNIHSS